MTLFIFSIVLVLTISAVCSMTEAALYAVRAPYVRMLAEQGNISGKVLLSMKDNMERPISAVLILNTVANTAGAAVAGAQAQRMFGESALVWFSVLFTLAVLFCAEIIPKIIGVVYSGAVARTMAIPLQWVITGIFPLIWLAQQVSILFKPSEPVYAAPEDEVQQMAMLSAEEGSILPIEAQLVRNVLKLDDVTARDLMTPRTVVFKLPADMTLREVPKAVDAWTHSRIPVYDPDEPEDWLGLVYRREVLKHMAEDRWDEKLGQLAKPLFFVPEGMPGHVLLRTFLTKRSHLFGVVDEYGGLAGIITLEDVLEALLGEEIVDEADQAVDMQEVARMRHRQRLGQSEPPPPTSAQ